MKKDTLLQRFRYWIDRRMARGTSSMVKLLVTTVLSSVLIVSVLVLVFSLHKDGKSFLAIFWDNFRSAMSSSFPSSDSGGLLYIVLYTFLGLIGMIFTGMLIGIFSSTIRGKLVDLQKNNPKIVTHDHVVVLGFRYGEYALLEQLIQAAGRSKRTIVVAEKLERTDMEQAVRLNVKVPRRIHLTFIKADITNPHDLECCAIPRAKSLIYYVEDKGRAVKSLLAVSALLKGQETWPKMVVSFNSDSSVLPTNMLAEKNIRTFHAGNVVARTIARAATQTGVFEAFMEIINFRGHEFYFEKIPQLEGRTFAQAALSCEGGVIAGFERNGAVFLSPAPETVLEKDDEFVVFEEDQGRFRLALTDPFLPPKPVQAPPLAEIPEVLIIGINREITTVLRELPDNIRTIRLAGLTPDERAALLPEDPDTASEIVEDYRPVGRDDVLMDMVQQARHLILLSDDAKSPEEADTEVMIRIMKLRDIKKKYALPFSITAEIRCENNRRLIHDESGDDFVVATDMSSMILAQVSEDPKRSTLFNELLAEEGSEIYLKKLEELGLTPRETMQHLLRRELYAMGYILLGLRTKGVPFLPLSSECRVVLKEGDRLVVIGEK
nr:hypothetical protein [Lachnospiraceae bacterium]